MPRKSKRQRAEDAYARFTQDVGALWAATDERVPEPMAQEMTFMQRRANDAGLLTLMLAWRNLDAAAWHRIGGVAPPAPDAALDSPEVSAAIVNQSLMMWQCDTALGLASAFAVAGILPISEAFAGYDTTPLDAAEIIYGAIENQCGDGGMLGGWLAARGAKLTTLHGLEAKAEGRMCWGFDATAWVARRARIGGYYAVVYPTHVQGQHMGRELAKYAPGWKRQSRQMKNGDAVFYLMTPDDYSRLQGMNLSGAWVHAAVRDTAHEFIDTLIGRIRD